MGYFEESGLAASKQEQTRYIVTWQVNHEPRQFSKTWLNLNDAKKLVKTLMKNNEALNLNGWSEGPAVLEAIDEKDS